MIFTSITAYLNDIERLYNDDSTLTLNHDEHCRHVDDPDLPMCETLSVQQLWKRNFFYIKRTDLS